MSPGKPVDDRVEFRGAKAAHRFPFGPDFEDIGGAFQERTLSERRADDPAGDVELRDLAVHAPGVIIEAAVIVRFGRED